MLIWRFVTACFDLRASYVRDKYLKQEILTAKEDQNAEVNWRVQLGLKVLVNSLFVQLKAVQIVKDLQIWDAGFKPSCGWLHCFMNRYGLFIRKQHKWKSIKESFFIFSLSNEVILSDSHTNTVYALPNIVEKMVAVLTTCRIKICFYLEKLTNIKKTPIKILCK